jgi:hypothetical protein
MGDGEVVHVLCAIHRDAKQLPNHYRYCIHVDDQICTLSHELDIGVKP